MNTTTTIPGSRPLVPSDVNPAQALGRAAWAATVAAARKTNAAGVCERTWPRDPVALHLLTRAAQAGATTSTPAWAGVLVQRVVSEWLGSLAPASAAAALIGRGITVQVAEGMPIAVPIRASAPTALGFVSEGGAIPVRSWAFSTVDLMPRKMGVIVVLSRELAQNSGALPIFAAILDEEAALSLDAAYFSVDDGSTAGHHPGLLNGLVAGAGSAVMATDLAKLAEAVGAGGSGQVVFVMGPGRAAATVRMPAEATATILPSLAVPEDRVIAIDPGALVHGFGPEPDIRASEESVIHMDSAPANIGTPGTPAVVAAPSQSMFQTNQLALRLVLDIAFASRRSGAVAFANGCTW